MDVVRVEGGRWSRVVQALGHPVRVVTIGFAMVIAVGTGLLMLPAASADGATTPVVTALFTATSAVCVTGLVVVDTGGHWSTFGEVVVLGLIQVGGFGVMTMGSMLVLLVGRKLTARADHLADTEHQGFLGMDARTIALGITKTTLVVEALVAVALAVRFWWGYGEGPARAAYLGAFHAVSAFNNAGFGLWADSLTGFVGDPWVCLPVAVAVVLGGVGFPVLWELRRKAMAVWSWSLHTWLTLLTTGVLLVGGTVLFTALEWSNPSTFGALSPGERVLAGFFHAVNTRTSGFNSVPTSELGSDSLFATDVLMFIGGGSAGTAGGIKVTTFAVLAFVILAELRGDRGVSAWFRSIPSTTQRQALTVALLGVGAVVLGTWTLLALTQFSLDVVLFEVTSAFGTVGLSTGITAQLPTTGQLVLVVLMFLGRVGPLTMGAALALRPRALAVTYPHERPVVG